MPLTTEEQAELKRLSEHAADQGRIIEMGWLAMEYISLRYASPMQRAEMRNAFFFGAQHLFATILEILEPGFEPTEKDLVRVDLIAKELAAFVDEMKRSTN